MSFISLTFAVFFFIFVILYHLTTKFSRFALLSQKLVLLFGGLCFYAFADLRFLPFLFYLFMISYFAGLCCKNRGLLIFFVLADLSPLLAFKYCPSLLHVHWIFPLGLFFFTFQSIGYIADVYKKKIESERNPLDVALFVSFFPVISSGPIQRAGIFIPQLNTLHHFDYDNATDGMKLFAWGMFKKIVIADRIALYVNYVYGSVSEQHGLALLLATVLYSFQIYCDFSGYTDMATGIARYLGFDAGKNFDHPYFSKSVGEFWRRWHISLSSWLRDYVYIPLGGSRVALPRIYLNLMITFLISGIWHGSTWNFVIWGALHGLFLCVERATKTDFSKGFKIIGTFALVTFAWIFFRSANLHESFRIIKKMMCIPFEIVQFFDLRKSIGAKEAIRTLFSLFAEDCIGFKGLLKIFGLTVLLLGIEFSTLKKSGLEIIKTKKTDIRWLIYILCALALLKTLPLKLDSNRNYSTNFIYQNF